MHTRAIRFEAYESEDGLWDIEGFMVDTKTYAVKEPYRGHRPAGAHVHDMALRLTLDAKMVVRDIEVSPAHAPYEPCFTVAPAFKGLIGAQIGAGWRKAIADDVHLRNGLNVHAGKLTCRPVAEAQGLPYTAPETLAG